MKLKVSQHSTSGQHFQRTSTLQRFLKTVGEGSADSVKTVDHVDPCRSNISSSPATCVDHSWQVRRSHRQLMAIVHCDALRIRSHPGSFTYTSAFLYTRLPRQRHWQAPTRDKASSVAMVFCVPWRGWVHLIINGVLPLPFELC